MSRVSRLLAQYERLAIQSKSTLVCAYELCWGAGQQSRGRFCSAEYRRKVRAVLYNTAPTIYPVRHIRILSPEVRAQDTMVLAVVATKVLPAGNTTWSALISLHRAVAPLEKCKFATLRAPFWQNITSGVAVIVLH